MVHDFIHHFIECFLYCNRYIKSIEMKSLNETPDKHVCVCVLVNEVLMIDERGNEFLKSNDYNGN